LQEQGTISGESAACPQSIDRPVVDRFVLANGLEVWHHPRQGSGTVSLIMVVRAGARCETVQNNGISHFLEHMVFDGTERWNEHEIKEIIRRRGGYFNAQTNYEHTAYEAHLPAGDFELALDWLTEVVFRATLPEDKVERERQVLIQEKGGRSSQVLTFFEDRGFGYDLGLAVRRRLFPGSSLGLRVGGEDASLARIDREMLLAYYQRYYRPNNMALIVVGDVTAERVRTATERILGGFPAGPVPEPVPAPKPLGRGVSLLLRGPNFSDRSHMRCGARTVDAAHSDVPALELLAEVLSDRLTDEVRLRRGLVYSIGAYNVSLSDVGYFVVHTESDGVNMAEIQEIIERNLKQLCEEPLSAEELAQAKAQLTGQFALSTQSNVSLAWLYAGYSVWCRAAGMPLPDFCADIERSSAEDVMRVAQRYFVRHNTYLALYRPAFTLKTAALGVATGITLMLGMMFWQRENDRRERSLGQRGGHPG